MPPGSRIVPVEIGIAHVEKRHELAPPCRIHEKIDPPERSPDRAEHLADARRLADIARPAVSASTVRPNLRHHPLDPLGSKIDDDRDRAGVGEKARERGAEPAAAAGYDRDRARESSSVSAQGAPTVRMSIGAGSAFPWNGSVRPPAG